MIEFFAYYGIRALEMTSAIILVLIFLKVFSINYQLKHMSTVDLIINFVLGAILGGFLTNDNITITMFAMIMVLYMIIIYVINYLTRRTNWGRNLIVGQPKTIIKDGKLNEKVIRRLNISAHDIASALRDQEIHSLTQVNMAQIEPGGELTVIKKDSRQNSLILIDNGVVDTDALGLIKRTPMWLKRKLREKNIRNTDDVFVAQWFNGRLYIVKKN